MKDRWLVLFIYAIGLLLILVIVVPAIHCQQVLPEAPRPQHVRPPWDFYATQGAMWASIFVDERLSANAISHGCGSERTPRYRLPNGGINSRKYYAENLSLAAGITIVSYLVQRYMPNRRAWRIASAAAATGVTTIHSVEIVRWIDHCY